MLIRTQTTVKQPNSSLMFTRHHVPNIICPNIPTTNVQMQVYTPHTWNTRFPYHGMLWIRKPKCCFDIHAWYRVAQTSVTRLVECTLDFAVNFFITYRFYKNCLKWEPPCSLHNSQRCYTVSDWLLQLCMNIPANTGKWFELAHFWTVLYVTLYWACEKKNS